MRDLDKFGGESAILETRLPCCMRTAEGGAKEPYVFVHMCAWHSVDLLLLHVRSVHAPHWHAIRITFRCQAPLPNWM